MRILHTSDWHIGRTFHGNATIEALRGVLDAMVEQVREHRVDAVLVAGDVFDSSTPAAGAYTLLTDTLAALADAGASVIVTSGNHDSAARLGFQAGLLRAGISVLTDPARVDVPVTLHDEHGDVDVYGIPYLDPGIVRGVWSGSGIRTQEQALRYAMELIRAAQARREAETGARVRSIVMSHCFAAGIESTPGLEREVRQGTLDVVPVSVFDGADYVALGHIHGRQQLSDRVRYSGAALHYSFGEKDKPRGAWLVDLDAAGIAETRWLDLPVPRRLVVLRGEVDQLLSDPSLAVHADAWVSAEYTDRTAQRDVMRRLQERFPFCAQVQHTPVGLPERQEQTYGDRLREAVTDEQRIDAFLDHVRDGVSPGDDELAIMREVLAEHARKEHTA